MNAGLLTHHQELQAQREELLVLLQENEQMRQQLAGLTTELGSLREPFGSNSRNSSKPPFSDCRGFKPAL